MHELFMIHDFLQKHDFKRLSSEYDFPYNKIGICDCGFVSAPNEELITIVPPCSDLFIYFKKTYELEYNKIAPKYYYIYKKLRGCKMNCSPCRCKKEMDKYNSDIII